jgi:hypothetical protein
MLHAMNLSSKLLKLGIFLEDPNTPPHCNFFENIFRKKRKLKKELKFRDSGGS